MFDIFGDLSHLPLLELAWKIGAMLVLAGFLPLTALSYCIFRRRQRRREIKRILVKLAVDADYEEQYRHESRGTHFLIAVTFATAVSLLGLMPLLLGAELKVAQQPNLLLGGARLLTVDGGGAATTDADLIDYQMGALMVFGMAFLGAYFWTLQDIFRRYSLNDLSPGAYFSVSVRMIFACLIATVVYHLAFPLTEDAAGQGNYATGMWPAMAFLIGCFPQRGLQWLQQRIQAFGGTGNPTVRDLPLAMIEGMTVHDELRLSELGIDNCYDLAVADFIPVLLKTPYPARELIDWILQAKLCAYIGTNVLELRQRGIRTIVELERLIDRDDAATQELAAQTHLTALGLRQAAEAVRDDPDIRRLRDAAHVVSEFSLGIEVEPPPSRPGGEDPAAAPAEAAN